MGLRITIGGPFYNEEEGITFFLEGIENSLRKILEEDPSHIFSLILVNDGSLDKSAEKVEAYFRKYHGKNERIFSLVKIVNLSRNFGHSAATSSLLDLLGPEEDALILMDTDLQDAPELIGDLIFHYKRGHHCVRIVRGKRPEGLLIGPLSKIFYRLFAKLSMLPTGMGTFGLFDNRVVQVLRTFPEKQRYLPGLFSLVGFSTHYLHYDRSPRRSGESKVGVLGLFSLATKALFSFSIIPIHLIAILGLLTATLSLIGTVIVVGIKIFTTSAIPGWASLLGAQFFIGGCILFGMGVLGEYIGAIFQEVKARPSYIIQDELEVLSPVEEEKEMKSDQNSLRLLIK